HRRRRRRPPPARTIKPRARRPDSQGSETVPAHRRATGETVMHTRTRAFSLIELVIVVVILGIIAAIAAPRMSRGSKGAIDSALKSDLAVLRNAIELYQIEHDGLYPSEANF